MNLVAPHLSVTEQFDDEQSATDTIQQNQFDPSIFKMTLKTSKSKKILPSKNTNLN